MLRPLIVYAVAMGLCIGVCSDGYEIVGTRDWGPGYNDSDGDGFGPADGDCNDADPALNPRAQEVCDELVDENCNGQVDEGCAWSMVSNATISGDQDADRIGRLGASIAWTETGDFVVGSPERGGLYGWPDLPLHDVTLEESIWEIGEGQAGVGIAVAEGDLDGDGVDDVVVSGPGVTCFRSTDADLDWDLAGVETLAVVDVDGDAVQDVVVGGAAGVLFGPVDTSATFGWTLPGHALPRVADVDGDGVPDVVAVLDASVQFWSGPGRTLGDPDAEWAGVAADVALMEGVVAVGVPTENATYTLTTFASGPIADVAVARLEGPEDTGAALAWLAEFDGAPALIIGSPGASNGGEEAGEVGLWRTPLVSGPADIVYDDDKGARLGSSVVVFGSSVVAGGPAADEGGAEAGAFRIFTTGWQ